MILYDVLRCSMMFYVLRAFLVSFCRGVHPEFLRSFLALQGALFQRNLHPPDAIFSIEKNEDFGVISQKGGIVFVMHWPAKSSLGPSLVGHLRN